MPAPALPATPQPRIMRWGIIGCGNVCEVKSGPGFQRAQGSALVAVMRRDADKAADFARRHQVPRWYSDAAALIADPEVDAIYVASPVDGHEQYVLMAAQAKSQSTSKNLWPATPANAAG